MFGECRLPRCPARGVSKDVHRAPDPDPDGGEGLQLESPVRHLPTFPTIIKLRFGEQIIIVVNVAKRLNSFGQTLVNYNALPQSIKLPLHSGPTC